MANLKILHVIASCDPRFGGPIEGVRLLGAAFRAAGHQQEILTLDHCMDPWVAEFSSPVHALGGVRELRPGVLRRMGRYLKGHPAAVEWLREHGPDYDGVVVDGLWNEGTRVVRKGLVGGRTPYVVFPHGMLDPWFAAQYPLKHRLKQIFWLFNEGVLLREASAVAFTCEQERQLARTCFRPWGMREAVVGFGTSAPPAFVHRMGEAFRAAVPKLGGRPYLLFLSRIHEKKGCDILLKAFAAVAKDFPETDLVMAGPGQSGLVAQYVRLAESLGIADRVFWPGMLSGEAKWGALYGCEAMALPSHQENFGIVVVEALACGKPVVISDQVNIHNEISEGAAGFVGRDNVADTISGLRELLNLDENRRATMGRKAEALFRTRFEMSSTARQLLEIFQAAAEGRLPERAAN